MISPVLQQFLLDVTCYDVTWYDVTSLDHHAYLRQLVTCLHNIQLESITLPVCDAFAGNY